ncbi:MAG: hypothetical protein JJE27_04045 [Thermoleophilia bacterium]|nr:hypothetical protein [Thermoleophilia bacterium]
MKRTLANRPVAAITVVFSVAGALILRSNPFGDGTIPWTGAIVVSLAGNVVLAYGVTGWAAPYLATSGGAQGARQAVPRAVVVTERWLAAMVMTVGILVLLAMDLTSRDLIISPTQRSERNAQLVRETVSKHAPREFQLLLTAADTWKLSDRAYRSCVPSSRDESKFWCVLVQGNSTKLSVTRYGPGISNAEQFLRWHPRYRGKRQAN